MTTADFSEAEIEAGRQLFAGGAEFLFSVPDVARLPDAGPTEIAFAGRSNVGKSSLINALTGQKALARTSNTPGRTQMLNFFQIADDLVLVDMPGYGYAKAPKALVSAWTDLIHAYLRGRRTLARVFVLIDSRHGVKATDTAVLDTLDKAAVSYQAVLTKADKVKPAALAGVVAGVAEALKKRPAAHPDILVTSSETSSGIDTLRAAIARLRRERGGG